ncbi:MAG: hypothetical protein KDA58_03100 [Planctomycetaceae bacterium]|nr:hypothetical protein [Planctomycetaceae bacterium]
MHKLGIAFLVLAIFGIITAFVFTTMLLDVRSKWRKSLETAQAAATQSSEERAKELRKVLTLEEEIAREMHAWGDAWDAPNSQAAGRNGIVQLGVGTGRGLAQKEAAQNKPLPDVFVFAKAGGNSADFLGQFNLANLQVDNATGQLTRTPYAGEEAGWKSGEYRVRDSIPAGWRFTFASLEGEMLIAQRKLESQRELLETINNQITESRKSLDQRLAELDGDAEAPMGASQEVLDGLVQTLRRLESERDLILAHVDQLRHELNDQYVQLRETMDANAAMVNKITQEAESAGTAAPQVTAR